MHPMLAPWTLLAGVLSYWAIVLKPFWGMPLSSRWHIEPAWFGMAAYQSGVCWCSVLHSHGRIEIDQCLLSWVGNGTHHVQHLLSSVLDLFDRNKILSGGDLSHYQVPHCIRVFFYFVWFVFIHHNFQFYFELCTYCNILDIYLS